jgi:hypothetical protein
MAPRTKKADKEAKEVHDDVSMTDAPTAEPAAEEAVTEEQLLALQDGPQNIRVVCLLVLFLGFLERKKRGTCLG